MQESEPKKRRKPLIYIRPTNVQEHLYPHKGAFFPRLLFLSPVRRRGGAGYHHFAKGSTDSPNRKRKRKAVRGKPAGTRKGAESKNGSSEGRPKKNGMDALWQQTFYTFGRCCKLFIKDKISIFVYYIRTTRPPWQPKARPH